MQFLCSDNAVVKYFVRIGLWCVYVLFLLFFFTTFIAVIAFIILPVFYGRFCLKQTWLIDWFIWQWLACVSKRIKISRGSSCCLDPKTSVQFFICFKVFTVYIESVILRYFYLSSHGYCSVHCVTLFLWAVVQCRKKMTWNKKNNYFFPSLLLASQQLEAEEFLKP